ncbi:hypothetical protein PV325_003429 [Microctonus aethiopoides]|uniref:Uncharacterized protein n=1 Tax=Microctonus aethiopoides TaxID=144406 RepID=A0AA39KUG7_9HYME|nr:hypothetical protein PV325_003429 [Microctonus aethiopoides]KAK0174205.1 hypothetical protein PV328_007314 [Microctonus aethiopoides]
MFKCILKSINEIKCKALFELPRKPYSERRRRKGDGTKTDIFEEKSSASQDEYFRKEQARQLGKLREKSISNDKQKKEKKKDKVAEIINKKCGSGVKNFSEKNNQ